MDFTVSLLVMGGIVSVVVFIVKAGNLSAVSDPPRLRKWNGSDLDYDVTVISVREIPD